MSGNFITGIMPNQTFKFPKFKMTDDNTICVYEENTPEEAEFIYEIEFETVEELRAKLKTYIQLENL